MTTGRINQVAIVAADSGVEGDSRSTRGGVGARVSPLPHALCEPQRAMLQARPAHHTHARSGAGQGDRV